MSLAGVRSNRGDAYQRAVALYWAVQMLLNDELEGIQVDSIGLPDKDTLVLGDDVVVLFRDGHKNYIQAKVNQRNHQYWKVSDPVLIKELISAKEQLVSDNSCEFHFYSRTPFGVFQRFVEEVKLYPNYIAFLSRSAKKHQTIFKELAELWSLDNQHAFELSKRIFIGTHHSVSQWETYCRSLLQSSFSRADTVVDLLWTYVDRQHSKLGAPQYVITRIAVLEMLEGHGIYHSLGFNEQVLLNAFHQFSAQGRQWIRSVGGEVIPRPTLEQLKTVVGLKISTVLLEDVAGGGKTCILLDLVDYLDDQEGIETLFIKGDLFSSIESLNDLIEWGLPVDLIAQCARLAEKRQLVVVIDSLDVLAVGRSHHALQSFLGFISELSRIPNITVIAASRTFDAKYDPLLRETSWSEKVDVVPLSFDIDIAPLLAKWAISCDYFSEEFKKLLLVPQNLRLFQALIERGISTSEIDGHDLYDAYIREVIEKDELLGGGVVSELQTLAADLLNRRSYYFSRNSLSVNPDQYQRLLSYEVLTEVDARQLMFSHQTLADALRIRLAQQSGVDLLSFVTSQPQFPFIRPSIRTYIQSLRFTSPEEFTRQLRQVLNQEQVATHIKRLVVETLAEMHPVDADIAILKQLSTQNPSLFIRFLSRATGVEWFWVLHRQWLPDVDMIASTTLSGRYLRYAAQYKNEFPDELIRLWLRALDEEWLPEQNLVWSIASDLVQFGGQDDEGYENLLERLLHTGVSDKNDLGRVIGRYVEQTGQGDELLWQFMTRGSVSVDEVRRGRELVLHCREHDLPSKDFLEKHLKRSDSFFRLVVAFLESFGSLDDGPESEYRFDTVLISETSWRFRHSEISMHTYDSIHELLGAVEKAFKYRSAKNDDCWIEAEKQLRASSELGIRYLLCEAYRCNIEGNIDGIIAQLGDKWLLKSGYMEFELGILSSEVYPYLPEDFQDVYQLQVMGLYDDYGSNDARNDRDRYEYLIWIPAPYRLPELNVFFSEWERKFGYFRPEPHISSWGGCVSSPVSVDQIVSLSSSALVRLLRHYNNYDEWGMDCAGGIVGGEESVTRVLGVAASLVPLRFIPEIKIIEELSLSDEYIFAIIRGVATHLDARFGHTRYSEWKAIEPLPEGPELAVVLLTLLERYAVRDSEGYCLVKAVMACCNVLVDDLSIDRLCYQLWCLSTFLSPDPVKDSDAENLVGRGINSVRGIAAECVLILCNKLMELDRDLTADLCQLLERYAKDSSIVVRATFLRRLPYLLSQKPELGWSIIDFVTRDGSERLLKHLEQCLYYNYYEHFDLVSPFLGRLYNCSDDKNSESWGRLITLSYLAGHVDQNVVFNDANTLGASGRGKGIGQVFVANLTRAKDRSICIDGLAYLIKLGAPASVFGALEHALDETEVRKSVPTSLLRLFLQNAPEEKLKDIDGIFTWMVSRVFGEAEQVLSLLEILISRFDSAHEHFYFHRSEDLIVTLQLLLKEADVFDDEEFIRRVLDVQDWFIDKGVSGVEELLEAN